MESILIVDDDVLIANAIKKLLENEGYTCTTAFNGLEALELMKTDDYSLIILDIMMPKLDGLSTLIQVRQSRNLPVIILSAKTEDSDKVLGLSMGADDYVAKPFVPAELVARVKSHLRRYFTFGDHATVSGNAIVVGSLSLDCEKKELLVDGREVRLTPTEYNILSLLMKNKDRVFSAEEIYENVWNEQAYRVENTVMVHIRRIREKIEINPKNPEYLKVVWGIGYKIDSKQK